MRRMDDTRNMRRFYRLDVQRDLFGQRRFIREGERIGSAGQVRTIPFDTEPRPLPPLPASGASAGGIPACDGRDRPWRHLFEAPDFILLPRK
ncbi:WGR domain-containing protein [Methylocystis parvus]|uniref:WGR domain-containing protein n=1 Tax=Methylocystis parvus TaxID=134 RepID=UPI001FCB7807|nr:WGR domain-containing protein [Methylocystis parvus]WBK02511.1 WGR domain-containing protein [Methylocystis parvus OBBP]